MARLKPKTFVVTLRVIALLDHEVQADTLEAALEKARAIDPQAAIDSFVCSNDWSVKVVSVNDLDLWDTNQ